MNQGIITAAYIGATVLFILALGGLSKQETARRGNFYGIAGMSIALIVTISTISANFEICPSTRISLTELTSLTKI